MKYLLPGMESQTRFDLMIQFTRIKSVNIIGALRDHLVHGLTEDLASFKNGLPQQNSNRALIALESMVAIHEKMKEVEFRHFKDQA